jgi:hypothetical protein
MLPKIPEGKPSSPRPRGDRRAKSSSSRGNGGGGKSAGASASGQFPPVRKIPKALEMALLALNREEELFRSTLEMQEGVGQSTVALLQSDHRQESTEVYMKKSAKALSSLTTSADVQQESMSQLLLAMRDARSDVFSTRSRIEKFFEHQDSDERKAVDKLKIDYQHLVEKCAQQETLLELQSAEVHSLREQLSRRILRNSSESNFLRHLVQDELQKSALDINTMKKVLHEKIDGAVLAFQKPSYTTALQSLKDHVDGVQKAVQDQADGLHILMEEIGAKDRFFDLDGDGGTMHTNLPQFYRKELRGLSRDHLLNILDVVSFEDGVVDAVGKAIRARKLAANGIKVNEDSVAGTLLS